MTSDGNSMLSQASGLDLVARAPAASIAAVTERRPTTHDIHLLQEIEGAQFAPVIERLKPSPRAAIDVFS